MAPRIVLSVSTLTLVAVSSLGLTVVVDLNTLMVSPNESTDSKVLCSGICWPNTNNHGHKETSTITWNIVGQTGLILNRLRIDFLYIFR